MAQDLYGKSTQFGQSGILTADVMKLSVQGGGASEEGFLVQNITLQYNQPLNRIYEIGSNKVYFAPGRSIGSLQLGRIIGKEPITAILGDTGTGVWEAKNVGDKTITLSSDPLLQALADPNAPNIRFTMSGATVESYGFVTDANGILVQENVTIQFAGLELNS